MCNIETYVFFDIETTGLPWRERNRTKITELSFVAALKKDIMRTKPGDTPPVSKLTLVFNPMKAIHPDVVLMTGLSNDLLQFAPLFKQKLDTLFSFIQELPKPVCLVAHNGNNFDYKIFNTEFQDANFTPPLDLLCVDSLVGFRKIFTSKSNDNEIPLLIERNITDKVCNEDDNLITDDEDEWPDLNVSTEEWEDLDRICESLSDISCEDITETDNSLIEMKRAESRKKVIQEVFKKDDKNKKKESFALLPLYRRLLNREPNQHHRAEEDCLMLLQCVVATKEEFLPWADKSCRKLSEFKPLVRH